MSAYDSLLGKREVETDMAETFEAEFPVVTGRSVEILSHGESPDCIARIDGVETGVELTSIKAGSAEDMVLEIRRLASKKHKSYKARGLFQIRPIILLGHLDWPGVDVEGPALYDVWEKLEDCFDPSDFVGLGFSEIWLMDETLKYTSRKDPRCPADFFCFGPAVRVGFWEQERKRPPYWSLIQYAFL
jgi:hypothetical protein